MVKPLSPFVTRDIERKARRSVAENAGTEVSVENQVEIRVGKINSVLVPTKENRESNRNRLVEEIPLTEEGHGYLRAVKYPEANVNEAGVALSLCDRRRNVKYRFGCTAERLLCPRRQYRKRDHEMSII